MAAGFAPLDAPPCGLAGCRDRGRCQPELSWGFEAPVKYSSLARQIQTGLAGSARDAIVARRLIVRVSPVLNLSGPLPVPRVAELPGVSFIPRKQHVGDGSSRNRTKDRTMASQWPPTRINPAGCPHFVAPVAAGVETISWPGAGLGLQLEQDLQIKPAPAAFTADNAKTHQTNNRSCSNRPRRRRQAPRAIALSAARCLRRTAQSSITASTSRFIVWLVNLTISQPSRASMESLRRSA